MGKCSERWLGEMRCISKRWPKLQAIKRLPCCYRTGGLTTEIAPDGDVLWIDGPIELTPVSSTAIVRQRSDQLIIRRDKRLQRRVSPRARRLNAQSPIAHRVFGARDGNSISAARCGIDGQSSST